MLRDAHIESSLEHTLVIANLIVRECSAEDLPALEWFGLYRHHREIFAEAFARHLRDENIMLVADLKDFPVGQAWIDLTKRQAEGIGYIWAVRVFPFLRGLGIGSTLMSSAERVLRDRGIHMAEVGVEKDNADARRLYERLGYVQCTELREQYGYTTPDGVRGWHVVDQWIMRKRLPDTPAEHAG